MIITIETHLPDIIRLCEEYGISRLELFGSAVTGEFSTETSDFDFLVEYPQDIAHAYDAIDNSRVWSLTESTLPELHESVCALLEGIEP